jgi:hypothetical protein
MNPWGTNVGNRGLPLSIQKQTKYLYRKWHALILENMTPEQGAILNSTISNVRYEFEKI